MSYEQLAGADPAPTAAGAGLLLFLAVLALTAVLMIIAGARDNRSRHEAWVRIAAARRSIQEWDQELRDREQRVLTQEQSLLVSHDDR